MTFSLKQNVEVIRSLGVDIRRSKICGGGAKNRLWCRLLATVLGIELEVPVLEHGGVLGACLLAAKGSGNDIAQNFYGVKEAVLPDEMYADFFKKNIKNICRSIRR